MLEKLYGQAATSALAAQINRSWQTKGGEHPLRREIAQPPRASNDEALQVRVWDGALDAGPDTLRPDSRSVSKTLPQMNGQSLAGIDRTKSD